MADTPEKEMLEDDVLRMIEQLMDSGTGHLTVTPEDAVKGGLKIDTYRSMDCSKGNMACCQPTEFIEEE